MFLLVLPWTKFAQKKSLYCVQMNCGNSYVRKLKLNSRLRALEGAVSSSSMAAASWTLDLGTTTPGHAGLSPVNVSGGFDE